MTLIVSARMGPYVAQASDCRLTIRRGSDVRTHSDVENKAIIFWANDGIGLLGYTGNAYISGIPTDEWIVRTITSVDMGGCVLYNLGGYIHRRNFGSIFHALQSEIESIAAKQPAFHLEVLVSGFKRHGNYLGSFITSFGFASGRSIKQSPMRAPRTLAESRGLHINLVGDPPAPGYIPGKLCSVLQRPPESAAQLATVMRSIIHDRSRQSVGVSHNTMSIFMDVQTRTICHESDLNDSDTTQNAPHTPWICGRTSIMAPSQFVGMTMTIDGWGVSSSASVDPSENLNISAASRKPAPK